MKRLETHSMYSRKKLDPGQEFVEQIMIPVARAMDCTIDFDHCHGHGRPLSTLTEMRL